ncbi:hypothetical protein [Sphingomicrobium marinum]|uniref:hypothetical protein n=1 Tax=Sphingomicrobium marinum TaxID=1227950 RepID=UPI00223F89FB|nr:hypothetical protein [Sphingomicrobium marinum]
MADAAGMIIAALALQLTPIAADRRWAAFEFDAHCEARVRAWRTREDPVEQPRLTFSFRESGGIELHANLRRVSREGSTAMLHIDGQPFALSTDGRNAWSGGGEASMIAALRVASRLNVVATDRAGRRFVDYYPLDGIQTAIDAAAACAAKKAGN